MKSLDEVIEELEDEGLFADALTYLKTYRDDKDDLTALRAYWKEQHENDPLDWETLEQMVGKPVWVVEEGYQTWEFWSLVYWMRDDELTLLNENGQTTYSKHEQGTVWQAYRKERS